MNIYTGQHTYSSPGAYNLHMEDPNRTTGINNIIQSVSVPFYLQSSLWASPQVGVNSSPEILAPAISAGIVGEPFVINLAAFDADGDQLKYELVDVKGANGQSLTTTYDPNYVQQPLHINPLTGDLSWTPQNVGMFTFAIQITECRNGLIGGKVTIDFIVYIDDPSGNPQPGFSETHTWQQDISGSFSYTLAPGDSLQLSPAFSDGTASSVSLEAYSDLLNGNSMASFTSHSSASGYIRKTFNYTASATEVGCAPHLLNFRGIAKDSNRNYFSTTDLSVLIFVKDTNMASCDSSCYFISTPEVEYASPKVELAPNPMHSSCSISVSGNSETYQFSLVNVKGEVVKRLSLKDSEEKIIHRDGLAPGVYLYIIQGQGRDYYSDKLIIAC
jgi:hypothetical protein